MVIVKTELDLLVRVESEARVLLKQLLLYECTRWESCVYERNNHYIIDHIMMLWGTFHLSYHGRKLERNTIAQTSTGSSFPVKVSSLNPRTFTPASDFAPLSRCTSFRMDSSSSSDENKP